MQTKKITLMSMLFCTAAMAQETAANEEVSSAMGIWDVLYGGSLVNLLIWIGLFSTSFVMIWLVIEAFFAVKRDKILPPMLIQGVNNSLLQGDLSNAIAYCDANPSPLANILHSAFDNIGNGYEVIQQAVSSAAEMENEKLMQKVNYLNICGQIAPMLGLMGTVTGMVAAFAGLANATGAAKAKLLAMSISTALWTTCVGLIISVPSLLFFTYHKNVATRCMLDMEATVLNLIKYLRNARVEE